MDVIVIGIESRIELLVFPAYVAAAVTAGKSCN